MQWLKRPWTSLVRLPRLYFQMYAYLGQTIHIELTEKLRVGQYLLLFYFFGGQIVSDRVYVLFWGSFDARFYGFQLKCKYMLLATWDFCYKTKMQTHALGI